MCYQEKSWWTWILLHSSPPRCSRSASIGKSDTPKAPIPQYEALVGQNVRHVLLPCDLRYLWSKLWSAHSRSYRSRFVQLKSSWKALGEIYRVYIFCTPPIAQFQRMLVSFSLVYLQIFQRKSRNLAFLHIFTQSFSRCLPISMKLYRINRDVLENAVRSP